jgi:fibronectin type 3 domain-containing protein
MDRALIQRSSGLLFAALALASCGSETPPTAEPAAFDLVSIEVVSYDTDYARILVKGSVNLDDAPDLALVQLYLSDSCSSGFLGEGTVADFPSKGIEAQVPVQEESKIFITTNSSDKCYALGSYKPDLDRPAIPGRAVFTPLSPSRVSYEPLVTGTLPDAAVSVQVFSDSKCQVPVGEGSADAFRGGGIELELTANATTSVFAQSVDGVGLRSKCAALGTYVHDNTAPNAPVFQAIAPSSPTNATITPKIRGLLDATASRVEVYSDPACLVIAGSGSAAEFKSSAGLQVEVGYQSSTSLWAQSFDEAGNFSSCSFQSTYVHDILPPTAPTFTALSPASPTNATLFPRVSGTSSADTSQIRFFKDRFCFQGIGFGSRDDFGGAGIQITAVVDSTIDVYAKSMDFAGNGSACTLLTQFTHDQTPPEAPIFSISIPTSPTNISSTPLISGVVSADTVSVQLYKSSNCATPSLVGQGSASDFVNVGLTATLVANATTPLYGRSLDEVGNLSVCNFFINYAHSNLPPNAPSFTATNPASPSRSNTTPFITGTASSLVATVALYQDAACTEKVGQSSRFTFVSAGTSVSLPRNTDSEIYSIATDVYGNASSCTYLTNYLHTDIAPSAPHTPLYSPTSPNNVTTTPQIRGQAPDNLLALLPTDRIAFYGSELCMNLIGNGDVDDFRAPGGVQINVSPNFDTLVHAKTLDAAGNESNCTSLGHYFHNTVPPSRPTFGSVTPGSPSYSRRLLLKGTFAASASPMAPVSVDVYAGSACTSLLTSGLPADFTGTGIALNVPANQSTPLYARARDVLGNESACQLMRNFLHTDVGPGNLNPVLLNNSTVQLTWNSDTGASPTPSYSVKRSTQAGGPYSILASSLASPFYVDTSVLGGATYYYVVSAANSTGSSKNSAESSLTISGGLPAAPIALLASPANASVTLTWTGGATAGGFNVYRSTTRGGPYERIARGIALFGYVDDSAPNDQPLFYVVRASNPNGLSLESNEAAVIPRALSTPPTQLSAVGETTSSACSGGTGVQLSWSPPPFFQDFIIRRGGSPSTMIQVQRQSQTQWTDCDTGWQSLRYYSVTATWGNAEATTSSTLEFDASLAPIVTIFPGNNKIDLSWTSSINSSQFRLFRAVNGAPFTLLTTLSSSVYSDTGLSSSSGYAYFVEPILPSGGNGMRSQPVYATPGPLPGAPSNLALRPAVTQAFLGWSPPARYNHFQIYRASAPGGPWASIGQSTSPSYTDSAPASGFNYYRVTALWGGVESAPTSALGWRSSRVLGLGATASSGNVALSWIALSGISSYRIQRGTKSGGPYTEIGSTASTSFNDTTVSNGTGYFYVVVPRFPDATDGVLSTEVSALPGSTVPSGLTVLSTTSSSASVSWAKVNNASGYKIFQGTSSTGPWTSRGTVTVTNALFDTLTNNSVMHFTVSSIVSGSDSSKATAVSSRIVSTPAAPLVIGGDGAVDLTWSNVAAATGYTVLRSTDGITFSTRATGLTVSNYTDTATNGTLYYYRIQNTYATETRLSPISAGVTPASAPNAPVGLALVGNSTGTSVDLAWAYVPGATSYNLSQAPAAGGPWTVVQTAFSAQSSATGLSSGTTYHFRVSALNGSAESSPSNSIAVIPGTPPTKPTAQVNAAGNIAVAWSAAPGATTYDVLRSPNGLHFDVLASSTASLSYTDSSAVSGQSYTYRYLPRAAGGTPMATSAPSDPVNPGILPLAPGQLLGRAPTSSQVQLSWIAAPNITSYSIYRGAASGGPYTAQATLSSSLLSYTDVSVSAGNTYHYIVRSMNASGVESLNSNEVSLRMTAAPASLSALADDGGIELDWAASAGASSYRILRSEVSGGPYRIQATGVTALEYRDEDVEEGVEYFYVVDAATAAGVLSPFSPEASDTAQAGMDLLVSIELSDAVLGSNTSETVFERSRTSHDESAYDGAISYFFEVVALNLDSNPRSVELVDDAGSTQTSITVPANTTRARRFRVPVASLPSGEYRVALEGTPGGTLLLQVSLARVLIKQQGASRTRLYVPLLSSREGASQLDAGTALANTSADSYASLFAAVPYIRDTSVLSELREQLPWELETVVGASGGSVGTVALRNLTTSTTVAESEGEIADDTPTLMRSPFPEGAIAFGSSNEGQRFEVSVRCLRDCDLGSVSLYKAGLWVRLESLHQARVLYRSSLGSFLISATAAMEQGRVLIELGDYSQPVVRHQAVLTASGTATAQLLDQGAAEDGSGASTPIASSQVGGLGSAKSRYLSSPLTVISGRRFVSEVTSNSSGTLHESCIVIDASR